MDSKTYTLTTYIIFILGIFTGGLLTLVGLIMAYVNKSNYKQIGSIYYTHLESIIKLFWIYIIGYIISLILFMTGIGAIIAVPIIIIVSIYCFIKLVVGFIKMLNNEKI